MIPHLPTTPGYRPQAEDTSVEADLFYFTHLRQKPFHWRMERFISFNRSTRQLCLTAAQSQNPTVPIRLEYVRRRLGSVWGDALQDGKAECIFDQEGEVMVADPITFAGKVIAILESLSIRYYIGGSVASSLWGESRYTEDLDLIVEFDRTQAKALLDAFLNASFYISDIAVKDAVSRRSSSFNVLDHETLEKADLFILQNTPFDQCKMSRRISH